MAKALTFLNRVPIAPVIAAMFAIAAAVLVALTPQPVFERAVASSGLAAVMSIANPPLGLKARLLATLVAAAVTALIALLIGRVIERAIDSPAERSRPDRRDDEFDLGPYALSDRTMTPRAPIFADRELGAPLMSDEALKTVALPVPEAESVPDTPAFAPPPKLSLAEEPSTPGQEPDLPTLDAPLVLEEFDVSPLHEPIQPIEGETSIEVLIRRLEAGLARRDPPRPPSPAAPVAPNTPSLGQRLGLRAVPNTPFDEAATRALNSLRRITAR